MDPASFLTGQSRETSIRRDDQGRWWFEGDQLEHPNLVRAFDRWLDRAEDGRFCLRNDINWAYITLEGPAHFVRTVRVDGDRLWLALSNDTSEPLNVASLRQGPDGALYCDVRGGDMTARFDRHAMVQLEPLLQQDEQGVYLALGQEQVRPPIVADPLQKA
jgi:uncharacterized protein